jgi:AcrR family transcriptional regulator
MPRPTLRERRKQETRALLQAAALELFGRKGFAGTLVDQIATEAGVSRTTFFRYFPSKEAVLFADQDRSAGEFWASLLERPPAENSLRAFEEALVALARRTEADPDEKKKALDLWVLVADNPELRARWVETAELRMKELAAVLARREGLDVPAPRHLIAAGVGMEVVNQVNLEWQAAKGELLAEELLRDRFRVLRELAAS